MSHGEARQQLGACKTMPSTTPSGLPWPPLCLTKEQQVKHDMARALDMTTPVQVLLNNTRVANTAPAALGVRGGAGLDQRGGHDSMHAALFNWSAGRMQVCVVGCTSTSRVRRPLGPPRAGPAVGPILVVCFTNHALDSFLEDILDSGATDDLVRPGAPPCTPFMPLHAPPHPVIPLHAPPCPFMPFHAAS